MRQYAGSILHAETQVDLEGRLTRSDTSRLAALAERDAVRATLTGHEMKTQRSSGAIASQPAADQVVTRLENKLAQRERALVIARTRARQAEAKLAAISLEGNTKLSDGRLDWKDSDGILGYWLEDSARRPTQTVDLPLPAP